MDSLDINRFRKAAGVCILVKKRNLRYSRSDAAEMLLGAMA